MPKHRMHVEARTILWVTKKILTHVSVRMDDVHGNMKMGYSNFYTNEKGSAWVHKLCSGMRGSLYEVVSMHQCNTCRELMRDGSYSCCVQLSKAILLPGRYASIRCW